MVYHSQKDVASNCITFGENTPLKLIEEHTTLKRSDDKINQ